MKAVEVEKSSLWDRVQKYLPGRRSIYLEGIALYNAGMFHDALTRFERITRQKPWGFSLYGNLARFYSGMALCNLGILHIYQGDNENAAKFLEQAVEYTPRQFAPYYYLGIALNNLEQFEKAMEAFNKVINLNPHFMPVKAGVAIVFYNEARYKEAEIELEKIVSEKPQWADMHFHLGIMRASQGYFQEGLTNLETAVTINPNYLKARIMQGLLLARIGNVDQGAEVLKSVLADRPQFADVHFYLGGIYASQDRLEDARKALEQAVSLNINFTEAYFHLAIVQMALGARELAMMNLRRVLQLRPDHREARLILAQIERPEYAMSKQVKDQLSKRFLDRCLEQLPRHVEIFPDFSDIVNIFSPEENRGLYLSLIRYYESVAAAKPNFPDVYDMLGGLFARLEQNDKAVQHFRRALDINPQYIRARIHLYKKLMSMGKNEEALREIQVLVDKGLTFPDLHLDRGRALMDLGRYDEAMECVHQALEVNPDLKPAYWLWSLIEEARGDLIKAAQVLEQYLTMSPDDPEPGHLLNRIHKLNKAVAPPPAGGPPARGPVPR